MANSDTIRVETTLQDGGLFRAFATGAPLLVLGQSSSGTVNTPQTWSQAQALVNAYGYGPGTELAAAIIEQGIPVTFVKTTVGTAGANSAVDDAGVTGTGAPTLTGTPYDDYDATVEILTGGALGTAGIEFRYTLDGGFTYSRKIGLGTAETYALPNTGITVDFGTAADTYVAGDSFTWTSTEPKTDSAEWDAAFDAVKANSTRYRIPIAAERFADQTAVEAFATEIDQLKTELQRHSRGVCAVRDQNSGEAIATWRTALRTEYDDYANNRIALTAGMARIRSAITGRRHRRPLVFLLAARFAAQGLGESIAKVANGQLPLDASLLDINGNTVEHDSRVDAGLSSSSGGSGRFITAKTYDGLPGVYFDFPSLMHSPASDYNRLHIGVVADVACELAQDVLTEFLADDLQLTRAGTLDPAEAAVIQTAFDKRAQTALLDAGLFSAIQLSVDTDTVISGGADLPVTLTGVPKYYAEVIDLSFSFTRSL